MMSSHHLLQATIFFMITALVSGRPCLSVVLASAKKQCEQSGRGTYIVYTTATECHSCCLCPAGSRKVQDCEYGSPGTTVCEACEFDPEDSNNQTYTHTENHSPHCMISANETLCLELQNTQYIRGTRTQASRCECVIGFHSSSDIMKHGCNRHSACNQGFQPAVFGTSSSDTRCEHCPPGTFSNVSSPTSMCFPFSLCESDQIILRRGTSKTDTICLDLVRTVVNQTTRDLLSDTNKETSHFDKGPRPQFVIPSSALVGLCILALILLWFSVHRCKNEVKRRREEFHSSRTQSNRNETEAEEETGYLIDHAQYDTRSQNVRCALVYCMAKKVMRSVSESENGNENIETMGSDVILPSPTGSYTPDRVQM